MKLRLGMIGGGPGAFIGAVHRIAARIDDDYQLVCGAFSSDAAKSKAMGATLGLEETRTYGSYEELIAHELQLPEQQRAQVISIVTPNHLHFQPAKLALKNGFHVILDKPATFSLEEALALKAVMQASGKQLCLTHTYTGYPMVKEARRLVATGAIGKVRKIYVQYAQGWLSQLEEGTGNKQAAWRTDPSKSGIAGAMGDIGTHAFNLAEYVSGCSLSHLCADINTVVAGRQLDDDGAVLLKFEGGASGVLVATQIATGAENNIQVSIYGEKGGLEWQQNNANSLTVRWPDKPAETWRTGGSYTSSVATHNTRTPAGHPEGYLEAFANLYHNFALTIRAALANQTASAEALDYPGIEEGIRGMAFIEHVITSGKSDIKWTPFIID
ncbi:Predicted dehydrogenase [Filimonas lacunae]|uniref:Predicted dehydrogenase n=1 Tax=Filimonas lacunae TaxID=477680 RepID=A0A173MDL2_9BACT|nr:Gfo/Idh/MocA family oxidoreductase [Filimonas lacunae]BAV05518.1 nucleoside-diphosphate-sugar epimerase [Filimonas lacunae]SIT20599.1 Predicted dehydrogenase [Filimonas lacunae]